jgi:thiol peroxidase
MPTTHTGGQVKMHGKPVVLGGMSLKVGDKAPDFELVDQSLKPVRLSDYPGVKVLVVVPSLDTSVCNVEARRFNTEAAKLGNKIKLLVISEDLPFAQARWCKEAGVDRIQTLSDHRTGSFGDAYGLMMQGMRLLARAVLVVDADNRIRYIQVVDEVSTEPDYDAALAAARQAAGI